MQRGGSIEFPEHLIFECQDLQWDREAIFGQKWPILGNPTVCGTNQTGTAAETLQAGQVVRPANSALMGQVSRVSTSSSNSCFLSSSWTIDQISEFVSVDSLSEIFVQHHIPMGETAVLNSTADSADVHFALH